MARLYTTEVVCEDCTQKVGLVSDKQPPKIADVRNYAASPKAGWTSDGERDYCPVHKRSKRGKA